MWLAFTDLSLLPMHMSSLFLVMGKTKEQRVYLQKISNTRAEIYLKIKPQVSLSASA